MSAVSIDGSGVNATALYLLRALLGGWLQSGLSIQEPIFKGWGMRISFVSEDQLSFPPTPEVRKAPKPLSKKELDELEVLARYQHDVALE